MGLDRKTAHPLQFNTSLQQCGVMMDKYRFFHQLLQLGCTIPPESEADNLSLTLWFAVSLTGIKLQRMGYFPIQSSNSL